MAKGRVAEVGVVKATEMLGMNIFSTYRLIWARRLEARKDANGKWLVSVGSIQNFKQNARRRRQAHRKPRVPALVALGSAGVAEARAEVSV